MKPPATLPERAQCMEEMTAMRLEQIRQVRPALDEVYATFTEDQKKTADEMVERFMRHGPGGRGGWGDHGHGMHGRHHGQGPEGGSGERRPG
jgi:periplasmic protein CpxP/Spy